MGAAAVGCEHLRLGIMRCGAPVTSDVLETKGFTLADARRCAQPTLVEGGAEAIVPATGPGGGARGISAYARASLVTSSRRCCGPASSSGSSTPTRSR